MSDENVNDQGKAIADSIAEHLKGTPGAIVQINPTNPSIPPQIANNLSIFLQRVPCTGPEAIAWVEAFQYVQQFVQQAPQGVPFTGLPGQKA